VRFRATAHEEDIIVPGHDEDDFVDGVGGDGEGIVHSGKVSAVVDDAEECAANGVAGFVAGEFLGSESGGIDDDVGVVLGAEEVFLVEEIALDGFCDEGGALAADELLEPTHGAIGVNDGDENLVGIFDGEVGIDAAFLHEMCASDESFDATVFDFEHLFELGRVVFEFGAEVKVGSTHANAGGLR